MREKENKWVHTAFKTGRKDCSTVMPGTKVPSWIFLKDRTSLSSQMGFHSNVLPQGGDIPIPTWLDGQEGLAQDTFPRRTF